MTGSAVTGYQNPIFRFGQSIYEGVWYPNSKDAVKAILADESKTLSQSTICASELKVLLREYFKKVKSKARPMPPEEVILPGNFNLQMIPLARIITGQINNFQGHLSLTCRPIYLAQSEEPQDRVVADYLGDLWLSRSENLELSMRLVEPIDFTARLAELSGGLWMRVRLARVLAENPGFIVLDEPTNNLDLEGRKLTQLFVERFSGGLLVISHDKELLRCTEAIIEISNQGIETFGLSFDEYWRQRVENRTRAEMEFAALKKQKEKIQAERVLKIERQERRMKVGAERVLKEGVPRIIAQAKKRRAQATHGKILSATGDELGNLKTELMDHQQQLKVDSFLKIDFDSLAAAGGKKLLSLQEFSWKYHEREAAVWNRNITWTVRGGERWWLRGGNGSGKSTLLKLFNGQKLKGEMTHGKLQVHAREIAFLDQTFGDLRLDSSLLECIQSLAQINLTELRNRLALFGFTGDRVFQKISSLSGGELPCPLFRSFDPCES